jgi:hypothetical protein
MVTRHGGRLGVRRGASTLGCLFMLLVVATAIYFGANAFESYWKYLSFRDELHQQVKFAAQHSDDQIVRRLRSVADSLGLPEGAQLIYITRANHQITIEAEYEEIFELPFFVRPHKFSTRAQGPY